MKVVIDIEANGLTLDATKIWMIVCKEIGQDNTIIFADQPGYTHTSHFADWCTNNVTQIVWHNGIRYDAVVIERILGYKIPDSIKQIDTMILSKLENFIRPETNRRHALGAFGAFFGDAKIEFDSSKFAIGDDPEVFAEMLTYCIQDVKLNEKVFLYLVPKVKKRIEEKPFFKDALRVEHEISKGSAEQMLNGWQFDFDGCQKLIDKITEEMAVIEKAIEPLLKDREVLIDTEPKKPQYKKDGTYTSVSARVIGEYLGHVVLPEDALKADPPMAPGETFQRKQMIPAGMGNQDCVKDYAETLGVKWTEWNWKKIGSQFIKTSSKFNDNDLLRVDHPHTKMISQYYTLRNRKSVMTGWMEQADGDGRIRGDVNDMGAASFRQTHKILANIPSGRAVYGEEMRSLFQVPKGKTLISADGASYQIRIAAHYLKSQEYVKKVLENDAHQIHADLAGVSRDEAKGLFFSILFGAGVAKVANLLGVPQAKAKTLRENFISSIPNFKGLMNKAQEQVQNSGYLPGIDGRKVFPGEAYKALNYLIQSCEACLMKATLIMAKDKLKDAGIDFKQLLFYHDEFTFEIWQKDEELAKKLIKEAFIEAPKAYNVNIMEAGDVVTGDNYYAVH